MKKILFVLLLIFSITANAHEIHPYHVGSVEFKYNFKSKTFQIIAKFFTDDLENAVNKKMGTRLFFSNEKQKKQMHQNLEKYTLSALKMNVNNHHTPINFIGYQENREMVHIYLETDAFSLSPSKVEVAVDMLYNLFDDQITIIHLIYGKQRKSHKLSYPNRYMQHHFKEE